MTKLNSGGKCILIFSGFNQRAIIAFLRTLNKNKLDYAIIAKSKEDEVLLSEFKDKVLAIRKSVTLRLDDLIEAIHLVREKSGYSEYFIAPTSEALNRFILNNRQIFEENSCSIPLVHKEIYELISNKYSFSELCSKYNILVPREEIFDQQKHFPIVAKPKKYISTGDNRILSPVIINNFMERERFLINHNSDDFYFQQFVGGKSIYLLYYFHRNGDVYKYSQENLIQQPDGKSMIAAISTDFHDYPESGKYEELFKDLNYFGLVMIEVKLNTKGCYMIEANPRFWGPSQLFVDANINFFEMMLHDFGFIENLNEPKCPLEDVKYFWFGGMIQSLRQDQELIYHERNRVQSLYSLPEFLAQDIYRRIDTQHIFNKEIQ